jgi:hypothetical protein
MKKMIVFFCLTLGILPFSQMAQNDEEIRKAALIEELSRASDLAAKGFLTTQDYPNWANSRQQAFAEGFASGIFMYRLAWLDKERGKAIDDCVDRMNNLQIAKIIEHYIKEHPEEWHLSIGFVSYKAMFQGCGLSPKK